MTAAIAGIAETAWTPISYPHAVWDEDEDRWVSDAEVAETAFTAFTCRRTASRSPAGWSCAGSSGCSHAPRRAVPGRAVRDLPAPRVHHQLHPDHGRRRRTPPRPRDHRAGHRRAEGRAAGAPPVGEVRRERRLGLVRGDRVQPRPRRRRRRRPGHQPAGPPCAPRSSTSPAGSPPPAADWSCTSPTAGPANPAGTDSGPSRPARHPATHLTASPAGRHQGPEVEKPVRPAASPRPTTHDSKRHRDTIPQKSSRWIRAQPKCSRDQHEHRDVGQEFERPRPQQRVYRHREPNSSRTSHGTANSSESCRWSCPAEGSTRRSHLNELVSCAFDPLD